MSPTLLEGAIALLLVWLGWRIGALIAPWIVKRFRNRTRVEKPPQNQKKKPPYIIDT